MSAPLTLKTYRVMLTVWQAHTVLVDAASTTDAEAQAERLWSEQEELFSYKDGGIDDISIEEVLS